MEALAGRKDSVYAQAKDTKKKVSILERFENYIIENELVLDGVNLMLTGRTNYSHMDR